MIVTLLSDQLTIHIDTKGAQLTSVCTHSGVELLWQADPAVWGRHAPILFPIIGRLRDNKYTVHGKQYAISQHGFARDKEFTVVDQSSTSVTFQLEEDADTLTKYPFAFRLQVTYILDGGKLTKRHTVLNRDTKTMYYEVGGHDGFRTTLFEGEEMADYYIQFPGQSQIVPYGMDEKNYLVRSDRPYPLQGDRFPLPPRVFGLDTIVLENLPVHEVTLANKKNSIRLTMEFDQFPYLGIWTQTTREFTHYICIEPWTTLPECAFTDSALEHKPGIRVLEPGQAESLSYSFTVRE
ncbi:MAG: aldose 1-epimerase family protein [Oscillospiraceae bacterium]|nr:aldose 1-epimerase family protein [Oscillospiraceae bacterium]